MTEIIVSAIIAGLVVALITLFFTSWFNSRRAARANEETASTHDAAARQSSEQISEEKRRKASAAQAQKKHEQAERVRVFLEEEIVPILVAAGIQVNAIAQTIWYQDPRSIRTVLERLESVEVLAVRESLKVELLELRHLPLTPRAISSAEGRRLHLLLETLATEVDDDNLASHLRDLGILLDDDTWDRLDQEIGSTFSHLREIVDALEAHQELMAGMDGAVWGAIEGEPRAAQELAEHKGRIGAATAAALSRVQELVP